MSKTRAFRAVLVTILVAVGCAEEPTTTVPIVSAQASQDLALTLPASVARTLIQGDVEEPVLPSGPTRVFGDEGPPPDEDAVASVFGARTDVAFVDDWASSAGRHKYTGNLGRVETVATVSFGAQVIGTQPAHRQDYVPFLFNLGRVNEILAEAFVFVDQDCGLKVDGYSRHFAKWQWFLAGPAPIWGDADMSTQAFPPVYQPPCQEEPTPDPGYNGGTEADGAEGSDVVTCWYWVTYDPYTGEIYDADFLFCDGATEGG